MGERSPTHMTATVVMTAVDSTNLKTGYDIHCDRSAGYALFSALLVTLVYHVIFWLQYVSGSLCSPVYTGYTSPFHVMTMQCQRLCIVLMYRSVTDCLPVSAAPQWSVDVTLVAPA